MNDLADKIEAAIDQVEAARRACFGLPVLAMESDTHQGKMALWTDNGMAGCGQSCVAVNVGEYAEHQLKGIAALANVAAALPLREIAAALRAHKENSDVG